MTGRKRLPADAFRRTDQYCSRDGNAEHALRK
jgi:hypothetical protein